jgi:hypothetical protein
LFQFIQEFPMSQAHVEKYYDILDKDPALLESLVTGTTSADEFIVRAIAAAKPLGLEFTAEEAKAYQEAQQLEVSDGELSDQQLEGVAGGVHAHHHRPHHRHHHIATHISNHHNHHGHHGRHPHKPHHP